MQRKRGQANFDMSEPEFLISVMDRHADWCTVVCLVGGGQEINTGEAGISEWISALELRFPDWEVHVSPRIALPEYGSQNDVKKFLASPRVRSDEHLHLAVSMRSFRAEALSALRSITSLAMSPKQHEPPIKELKRLSHLFDPRPQRCANLASEPGPRDRALRPGSVLRCTAAPARGDSH